MGRSTSRACSSISWPATRLSLHAVGQPDPHRVRLAAALLPPRRRLRQDLQGADGRDRLGHLRHRQLREVRRLHGALRLRGERREGHGAPPVEGGSGVALRGVRTEGPMAPEIPLENQRPAEYVFSRNVAEKLAEIRKTEAEAQASVARQRPSASKAAAASRARRGSAASCAGRAARLRRIARVIERRRPAAALQRRAAVGRARPDRTRRGAPRTAGRARPRTPPRDAIPCRPPPRRWPPAGPLFPSARRAAHRPRRGSASVRCSPLRSRRSIHSRRMSGWLGQAPPPMTPRATTTAPGRSAGSSPPAMPKLMTARHDGRLGQRGAQARPVAAGGDHGDAGPAGDARLAGKAGDDEDREARRSHRVGTSHAERHGAAVAALQVAVARQSPEREELRITVIAQDRRRAGSRSR